MFNREWTAADLRPIVLTVIDVFGPARVMFGSNCPVDKLYNTYDALWDAYIDICKPFTHEERDQMFYLTAANFYHI